VTAFTLIDLFERMAAAGASDLHLCAGSPPVLRVRGELERLDLPEVSGEEMRALVYRITTLDQQKELEVERELDFSYALGDTWRFRLNASYDRDSVACAVRLVPATIPTPLPVPASSLGPPKRFQPMTYATPPKEAAHPIKRGTHHADPYATGRS